ncbi:M20/M25/M40 family metallo-hydrolase [Pontibacter sp. MBLB2868]|uniref:M20/M25/M40 family metallo-hydrolase n=1 Tax=Pontibacter sp. MBLB2868 TaxID=3451555 RepID=UPI003F751D90
MIDSFKILIISINLILLTGTTALAQTAIHKVSSDSEIILSDRAKAADKLADAIKLKTVSAVEPVDFHYNSFKMLHLHLQHSFPKTHQILKREVINGYSLLYTWQGSNPNLKPVLFSAHMDVVPVEKASEQEWQENPFDGTIKDGYIWGRGTMDDKYRVMAIMEAVERLLEEGYQPERTIYLAFGHDEEVGGDEGAGKISAYLAEQNIELEAVFDEGLAVAENVLPGISEPLALVGTASKGNLNLRLTVEGTGGHSSVPPKDTPIDILSHALTNLHNNPFEARMTETTHETVSTLAVKMGGKYKFAMRHYGLFKGKILKMLAEDRATDALIRTKMTPTIFEAGDKYNVLPRVATAVVNIRILNGETDKTVLQHVKEAINDDRVKIEIHGVYTPPSPVTSTTTWVYDALKNSIKDTFNGVMVVPALFPGATDSKHYTNLTNNIFRFAPQVVNRQSAQLIHNVNEKLSLEVYDKCIYFYTSLIQNTGGQVEHNNLAAGK